MFICTGSNSIQRKKGVNSKAVINEIKLRCIHATIVSCESAMLESTRMRMADSTTTDKNFYLCVSR